MVALEELEPRRLLSAGVLSPPVPVEPAHFPAADSAHAPARLSVARAYLSAVAVGNDVLFAGGETSEVDFSSVVDIYNYRNGRWTTASLSQARADMVTASADGVAIVASAVSFSPTQGYKLSADIYSSSTRSWTSIDNLPGGDGYNSEAIGVGDEILLMLGNPSMEIYDVLTRQISTQKFPRGTSPLIAQNSTDTIAAVGGNAYVMLSDAKGDNIVGDYDAATGTWSKIRCPNAPVVGPATSVGPLVYFQVKLHHGFGLLALDTLTKRCSVVRVRDGGGWAVASVGDKVVFSGGSSNGPAAFAFDISTGSVTRTPLPGIDTFDAGAGVVGTEAIFAGGALPFIASPSNAVDFYVDPTPVPELSGSVARGANGRSAHVTIDNTGDAKLPGSSVVTLYATTDGSMGNEVAELGALPVGQVLRPGDSVTLDVPMHIRAHLAPGTYVLLAAAGPGQRPQPFATQFSFTVPGRPAVPARAFPESQRVPQAPVFTTPGAQTAIFSDQPVEASSIVDEPVSLLG